MAESEGIRAIKVKQAEILVWLDTAIKQHEALKANTDQTYGPNGTGRIYELYQTSELDALTKIKTYIEGSYTDRNGINKNAVSQAIKVARKPGAYKKDKLIRMMLELANLLNPG
jgi:hypothetical protein